MSANTTCLSLAALLCGEARNGRARGHQQANNSDGVGSAITRAPEATAGAASGTGALGRPQTQKITFTTVDSAAGRGLFLPSPALVRTAGALLAQSTRSGSIIADSSFSSSFFPRFAITCATSWRPSLYERNAFAFTFPRSTC